MIEGRNIFFAGQTGSGKTYALLKVIAAEDQLITYLPKREDHNYPGVYFDGMEPLGFKQAVAWWRHCRAHCGRYRIVIRPSDKFDADEFDRLCHLVYLCGNCTFVAEECSSYLSTHMFDSTGRYQAIKSLLTAGRTRGVTRGITTYWVTQRCFGIPRHVTSESRDAYLFILQEPADKDYVQERFGIGARLSLDHLGQYEHVHWINTGQVEVGKA
jgi:hypothetical protein